MNQSGSTAPQPLIEVARGQATRDRILDAAEHLFGKKGVDGTSLREITAAANVNLAAVNYHYQSKEALLRAVVARRIGPINQVRLALLDEAERAAAPDPPALATILEALLMPVLELHGSARNFVPIMGRMYSEPGALIEAVIKDHMLPVAKRVVPLLQRALPYLTPADIVWRIHFTVGAVAHLLAGGAVIRAVSGGQSDPADINAVRRQLIPFLVAGFSARPLEVHS